MADNKTLPPTGTGTADIVVATDEISGVDYQKVKLVDGAPDSAQPIEGGWQMGRFGTLTDNGQPGAAGLPVVVGTAGGQ